MDLHEVGCGYVNWIGLAQDRDRWRTLVSAVMNLRVPRNAGNFLTSCKAVSFSRRTLHHGVSKYDSIRADYFLVRHFFPYVQKPFISKSLLPMILDSRPVHRYAPWLGRRIVFG